MQGIVESNPEPLSGSWRKSSQSLKPEDPLVYFYPLILSYFKVSDGGNFGD